MVKNSPGGHLQVDAVDRGDVAELLRQLLELDLSLHRLLDLHADHRGGIVAAREATVDEIRERERQRA